MYKILEFAEFGDTRGHLAIIEGEKDIPFEIKRVFYIYGTDSKTVRGEHSNRESEFAIINICGSSKIKIKDGRGNESVIELNEPRKGIYIPKMIWKEMYDFSEDSVLLCIASTHYDANEYIRDFKEYELEVNFQKDLI